MFSHVRYILCGEQSVTVNVPCFLQLLINSLLALLAGTGFINFSKKNKKNYELSPHPAAIRGWLYGTSCLCCARGLQTSFAKALRRG